jgi:hypothetical protein
MLAGIMAALHNGPMTRHDKRVFVPDMFMPGYEEPKPDPAMAALKAKIDFEIVRARSRKASAPNLEAQAQIAHRMKRAQEATENGATTDQVNAIMRGVL